MKTITNKFKIALAAVGLLAVGTVSAQTTTGNIGKQAAGTLGSSTGYVKVIDNKGTIKYLQSANGITQFTDNTPDGGVVTTWQLGGQLTTIDTSIDLNGNNFTIDGVNYKIENIATTTGTAATATTAASDPSNNNEWTVLVRNESTGNVEKTLAADLFQVTAIRREATPPTNTTGPTQNIIVAGLPVIDATNEAKLFVFRNGVKLRWDTDFTGTTAGSIDINISADLPLYLGDVIEVHYIN